MPETNETAQQILGLLAKTFTRLHEASKDGKIDTSEVLGTLMAIAPDAAALSGVNLGN